MDERLSTTQKGPVVSISLLVSESLSLGPNFGGGDR